jgi:monofunctional glycosyltransferase
MIKRLLLAVPLALIGAAWFYWITIPWPVRLRTHEPQSSAVMRQRVSEARQRGDELEIRHEWVDLERISPRLRRAVIVAEDGNFHEHNGIDWGALREEFRYQGDDDFSFFSPADLSALFASLNYYRENRERVRGRSTITQQLAKNMYYSTDRSLLRKLEEFVVARRLERWLDKDRILELYLNYVELGPGIFGAEAAARHYFSRSAADLSADQAAALAATLPHPLTSNPRTRPGRMEWRKRLILARMGGTGPAQTVPLGPDERDERDEPAPLGETVEPASGRPDPVETGDTVPAPIGDRVPEPAPPTPPPAEPVPPPL